MNRLEGKRALVTGGASEVGAAVVRALVEQGAMVVAVDTTDERIEQAVESLGIEDSEAVVTRGLDATDLVSWWDLANFVIAYYQELDVFVHIAECKCAKPALGLGIHELREAQATSAESFLMAITRLEEGLIESGKETEDGAVVIAISLPPEDEDSRALPFAATRASVVEMVKVMAREFESQGLNIRVSAIHPGDLAAAERARCVAASVLDLITAEGHESNGQELILETSTRSQSERSIS
jgi:NAD(P)-dependent dehydrogenase (short-subunit alcohol dehydrogenase family)